LWGILGTGLSGPKARPDLGACTVPRALRLPSAAPSGAQVAPPPPSTAGPHPRAAAAAAAEGEAPAEMGALVLEKEPRGATERVHGSLGDTPRSEETLPKASPASLSEITGHA